MRVYLVLILLTAVTVSAAIDVGSRKQLFVDHKFIESAEGVNLVMNPPMRTGEVLLTTDAPWESSLTLGGYCTVLRENGKTRLWYHSLGRDHAAHTNPDFIGLAYAESADGIRFQKPRLGLVEFQGSRDNNIVLPADPGQLSMAGGSVWIDENPDCPPQERYKSWTKIYPKKGTGIRGPHRVFASADGLRWKLTDKLVTGLRAADTQSTWFWDARLKRYLGYTREWVRFADGRPIRMASYNESDDLHTWRKMHIALTPDETDFAAAPRPMIEPSRMKIMRETWVPMEEVGKAPEKPQGGSLFDDPVPIPGAPLDIYGPVVFPYTEAEGVYVSMMSVFHHWERTGQHTWPDTGDVRLAVSRDGRHFINPGGRQPFLRLGQTGSFDSKWVWAFPRPIRMGDELWVYYFGGNRDHSQRVDAGMDKVLAAVSRAVMRLDGFVSADFDYAGGTLLTPPLQFRGSRLELNLDTGAGGVGRVEILDAEGEPIEGFTLADADQLNINSVRAAPSWRGRTDLSPLAGKTIRLHFKMRAAKLYAFQFQ
ncbi:MAG: hypothetical protein ACKV22_14870 [Bryobacteraceae bacterium]